MAKGILSDFDFKMVVDCFPGDGAWALANLNLPQPRPYVGMTKCNLRTVFFLKKLGTTSAIKFAMAIEGHAFCDNVSLQFIEGLFPDGMNKLEENDEEDFPDDDEEDQHSVPSEAEKENQP